MATFHTDEGFFFTATAAVNQAGQGEMAATHAMPLLKGGEGKGGGRSSDRMQRGKTNNAERPSFHLGLKSAAQKIPEHISFTHVVLKR